VIGSAQPDWFSHVLWAVYENAMIFSPDETSQEDIQEGAVLINPLTMLNQCIAEFGKI